MFGKFGVEYPFQSAKVRQRGAETFTEKYGDINRMQFAHQAFSDANNGLNPFQTKKVKEKIKETLIRKYGVVSPKYFHLSEETLSILKDQTQFMQAVHGKTLEIAAMDLGVNPT